MNDSMGVVNPLTESFIKKHVILLIIKIKIEENLKIMKCHS